MPDPWAVLGLAPGATVAEARAARRRLAKQLHPDLHEGRSADERAELARRMTAVNLALAELLDPAGPATGAAAPDPSSGAAAGSAGPDRPGTPAGGSAGRDRPGTPAGGSAGRDRPGTAAGGAARLDDSPGSRDRSAASGARSAGGSNRPAAEPRSPSPTGPDPWAGDHVHPAAAPLEADTIAVEALPAEAFEALFLVAYGLGEILVADEPYLLELYLAEPAPCFCRVTLVPVAGGSIVTLEVEPAEDTEPPSVEVVRDLLVAELDDLAGSPRP